MQTVKSVEIYDTLWRGRHQGLLEDWIQGDGADMRNPEGCQLPGENTCGMDSRIRNSDGDLSKEVDLKGSEDRGGHKSWVRNQDLWEKLCVKKPLIM